eukprot:1158120-Pelagomonas_calceolata.AAC.5
MRAAPQSWHLDEGGSHCISGAQMDIAVGPPIMVHDDELNIYPGAWIKMAVPFRPWHLHATVGCVAVQ